MTAQVQNSPSRDRRIGPGRACRFVPNLHSPHAHPQPVEVVEHPDISEKLHEARLAQNGTGSTWWQSALPPSGLILAVAELIREQVAVELREVQTEARRAGWQAALDTLAGKNVIRAVALRALLDGETAGQSFRAIGKANGVSGQAVEQAAGRLRDQLQREFAFTATLRPTAPGKRIPHHQPASTDTAQEAVASH